MEQNQAERGRMEKNRGSIIIEMCVIMPIVITVVFLTIHMMIIQINRSVALGEMYHAIYNKESYAGNNSDTYENVLKNSIFRTTASEMQFVNGLEVQVDYQQSGKKLIYGITGNLSAVTEYEESYPGIALLIQNPEMKNKVKVKEEIRDTSNNLRRWQLFGKKIL